MRWSKTVVWLTGLVLSAAGACERGPSRPEALTYAMTDLGPGRCVSINDAGQVVGFDANHRGFVISADRTRTDLGTLADDAITIPLAINTNGAIAGYAEGPMGRHAAIWAEGSWSAVPTTSTWSLASGIDDAGGVVGVASSSTGQLSAGRVDPKSIPAEPPPMQAFAVPATGSWTVLGSAGGANSAAYSVGQGNRIVGVTQTAAGDSHAFLHVDGKMRDLGTLGGTTSNAYGVNANGDVVGVSTVPRSGAGHAFLFTSNTSSMRDLGTLGGDKSDARSINDSGVVVGGSTTADGRVHPFVYRHGLDGKMSDLLPRDIQQYSTARAEHVANSGSVVGWGVATDEQPGGPLRCLMWTPIADGY